MRRSPKIETQTEPTTTPKQPEPKPETQSEGIKVPGTVNLFTYYEALPQMDAAAEQKLTALWYDRWSATEKFKPQVRSEWHAKSHPYYTDMVEKLPDLPSVNPGGYDRACYMRWLVAAGSNDAIVAMSDYDVIPYGFDPDLEVAMDKLCFYQLHVPALVIGPPFLFARVARWMIDYKRTDRDQEFWVNGRPHISDMILVLRLLESAPNWCHKEHTVKLYGEEGWRTADVVHYSNGAMHPAEKTPRWQWIPKLR